MNVALTYTRAGYIDEATKRHKGKYDYSMIRKISINPSDRIRIGCKTHGVFTMAAGKHLHFGQCPKCQDKTVKKPQVKETNKWK